MNTTMPSPTMLSPEPSLAKAHKPSPSSLPSPGGPAGPTPERLMQLAWGYAPPLIINAALHFRIFDVLANSPLTADALAAKVGASVRGITAILNALVGLELLVRNEDRYAVAVESKAFLVPSNPGYLGGLFQHLIQQALPQWIKLTEVVGSGRPPLAVNQDKSGPEFFAEFVESLFPLSYRAARLMGEHLGIPQAKTPVSVLDIGAGSGVWGIALAQLSPQVKIRAVDWPAVLEVTMRVAQRQGVADRLTRVPGDLLEADFGTGHHVATIGHILHSEGEDRSRKLLRKTYAALAPGGTVVISEFMPNEERTGPPHALIFAVNMLLHTETGATYTFSEMSEWLREAGFENPRLLESPAPSPLLLATRPR